MKATLLIGSLSVLLLTGCTGYTVNQPPQTPRGARLAPAQVRFIKYNVTTRAEVEAGLGTSNCVAIPALTAPSCPAALAYTWQGDTFWHTLMTEGQYAVHDHDRIWCAYFVAFDHFDKVIATTFFKLSDHSSTSNQLYRWASTLHLRNTNGTPRNSSNR